MDKVESKFASLETDSAPGQEVRSRVAALSAFRGDLLPGPEVDFSHGDVDAFLPAPGALEAFLGGVRAGGKQAYTEYRGSAGIRAPVLAARLGGLHGSTGFRRQRPHPDAGQPGEPCFCAMASTVAAGDKVAVVQPDYFANRKLVRFLEGEIMPVRLAFLRGRRQRRPRSWRSRRRLQKGSKGLRLLKPQQPYRRGLFRRRDPRDCGSR